MNCPLQRREISRCLKNKALNIKYFLNLKDLQMEFFKIVEQNKLLSHLFLSQKSNNTSFPTYQSIKIKQDKCETKSNRDQSKVMEHSIEVSELFHDPYPFEKFEVNQLPHLEKESLKFYKEQLKFADKDKALAFYFFEHHNLSARVLAGIKKAYNQFQLKYNIFSIDNLKNYFTNFDIINSMTSSSLSLYWKRMKRLAICSFGIKKQDFSKIKFSNNKQGRRMFQILTKIKYLKLQIFFKQKSNMKMHYSFISCGLLHLGQMRCSHWDLKILKTKICFVLCKQEQPKEEVHYLWRTLYPSCELSRDEDKQWNISKKSFTTSTRKTYTNHFVFDLTRSKLQKKFLRKFAKLIPDMKSRPKDIRMSSISNEFREHGIQRAYSFGLHTSVKTTKEHYTRIAKDFK